MNPVASVSIASLKALSDAFKEYAKADWWVRIVFVHTKHVEESDFAPTEGTSEAYTRSLQRKLKALIDAQLTADEVSEALRQHPMIDALSKYNPGDELLSLSCDEPFGGAFSTNRAFARILNSPQNRWHTSPAYIIRPFDKALRSRRSGTLLELSALASQALNQVLGPLERSWDGRAFDEIVRRMPMIRHVWRSEKMIDDHYDDADKTPGWRCVPYNRDVSYRVMLWTQTIDNWAASAAATLDACIREAELRREVIGARPEMYVEDDLINTTPRSVEKKNKKNKDDAGSVRTQDIRIRSECTQLAIDHINTHRDLVEAQLASYKTLEELVCEALEGREQSDIDNTLRNLRRDRPAFKKLRPDIRPTNTHVDSDMADTA